jgi:hypothetical protein
MVNRRREIKTPQIVDTSRMCSADHVRWYVGEHPVWGHLTDVELGEKLGLSAGYVGMILSGARPPTKAFLEAIGWEAVTLYQMNRRTAPLALPSALDSPKAGSPSPWGTHDIQ